MIEAGGELLLTAPLFSNPGPFAVLGGELEVEVGLIDRMSKEYALERAAGILVGHGHYDHLMDVPYLAVHHARRAIIYGSMTVRNQIIAHPGLKPERIRVVDGSAASPSDPGRWIPVGGRFRILPIRSKHSPHTRTIHLWQGVRTEPMRTMPRTAHDWLEGEVYAFLVEILDDGGRPLLHLYYGDSASTYPDGFPPLRRLATRDLPTVAILTAPGHKWEQDYPDRIISYLGADYALVGHWEYFFNDWRGRDFGTPTTDLRGFTEDMERIMPRRWWLPAVGARFVFRS